MTMPARSRPSHRRPAPRATACSTADASRSWTTTSAPPRRASPMLAPIRPEPTTRTSATYACLPDEGTLQSQSPSGAPAGRGAKCRLEPVATVAWRQAWSVGSSAPNPRDAEVVQGPANGLVTTGAHAPRPAAPAGCWTGAHPDGPDCRRLLPAVRAMRSVTRSNAGWCADKVAYPTGIQGAGVTDRAGEGDSTESRNRGIARRTAPLRMPTSLTCSPGFPAPGTASLRSPHHSIGLNPRRRSEVSACSCHASIACL